MESNVDGAYIPPLTEEIHRELRELEKELRLKLSSCCKSYSVSDDVMVVEYARTWAVKLFECYYDFYSKFPKFRERATEASRKSALQRTQKCIDDIDGVRHYFFQNRSKMKEIETTLVEQVSLKESSLLTKVMSPPSSQRMTAMPPVGPPIAKSLLSPRKLMLAAYRRKFPDAGILDICWAAKQTYRELQRWLKGQSKDDSKPDRVFRAVLEGDKAPGQIRREPRPKNWK